MTVDRRVTPDVPRPHGRRITDLAAHTRPFVTVQALAEHLDVHRKTVLKWIQASVLPAYQFGEEWRIKTADAIVFVAQARFCPDPARPQ